MKKLIVILLLVSALTAQTIQQEFLHPSKVRKKYKLKEFQPILYADDEVFKTDSTSMDKEFIETAGYRIQLISTQNLNEAITIKAQADSLFSLPVYVDFEPPNYKVRIGNYETKEAAAQMESELLRLGFKYAWVVPTKIIIVK